MKPGYRRDWSFLVQKLWPSIIGSIILWAAIITGIILLAGCAAAPSPYAWTPGDNSGQQWLEMQQLQAQQLQMQQQMQRAQHQQQLHDMGLSPWQQ